MFSGLNNDIAACSVVVSGSEDELKFIQKSSCAGECGDQAARRSTGVRFDGHRLVRKLQGRSASSSPLRRSLIFGSHSAKNVWSHRPLCGGSGATRAQGPSPPARPRERA